MGKLLQINPVIRTNTSTGRIMKEIGEIAISRGWESYLAYSKARDGVPEHTSKLVPIGNRLDLLVHWLATRLFDAHGLASRIATRQFVKRIREIDPDIIHIHNVHGYFLNYRILFDYLAKCGKPVIWTVHDCWLFTGHCYHYSAASCMKWKEGCDCCPQKRAFPSSFLLDRSKRNYAYKRASFTSVDDFTIVTVSEWMKREMGSSFLRDKRFKVIHNGIDTSVFKPVSTESVSRKYGLQKGHVILGVASIWLKEKGLDDLIRLSSLLGEDETLLIVGGMSGEQERSLPDTIRRIGRTSDVRELAALYSRATVLVNPTWQDNYPTVNLEAISCGTPVVTYATGGSVESVPEGGGFIVDQGDVETMLSAAREIEQWPKEETTQRLRKYALENFDKDDRYKDYIRLYEDLAAR